MRMEKGGEHRDGYGPHASQEEADNDSEPSPSRERVEERLNPERRAVNVRREKNAAARERAGAANMR